MALADFITPEFIALLVAILVPFGIAVYWLAVTMTKLNRLESDVTELRRDVRNLDIRTESHILARRLVDEMSKEREEGRK
jgi:hypothetical protein